MSATARDRDQLQEMTSRLQLESDEASKQAIPIIETAHAYLKKKVADFNKRHIAATDSQGGSIGWQDARRVAEAIERMEKDAREAAKNNLSDALKKVGVSEKTADGIADYLSRIIVAEGRGDLPWLR